MVPYKQQKNSNARTVNFSLNPNQLMYDLGLGAVEGMGKLATRAVQGIASAMRSRGATRQEVATLVAPLARSIAYGSRQPKFTKATGGLMIEHIESIELPSEGKNHLQISSESFSWLRNIASQFEEYQMKVTFTWNPACPATTPGTVFMAFDYDPDDTSVYATSSDYFNTADHCINAVWAPGALSPERSAWLKTGTRGEPRLWSPGTLHYSTPELNAGFMVVKYQVALRKPQPTSSGQQATLRGSFASATAIFGSNTSVTGARHLYGYSPDKISINPTDGYKTLVWTTDGNMPDVVPTVTNAKIIAVQKGVKAGFVVQIAPGQLAEIIATVAWTTGSFACMTTIVQTSDPITYN